MEHDARTSAIVADISDQEELDQKKTLRKGVEHFVQEELEELSTEEENDEVEKPQWQKGQKSEDRWKAKRRKSRKTKKAEVEEDLLTLLDEPWEFQGGEAGEKNLDKTLPEEPKLARKSLEQKEGSLSQGKGRIVKVKEERKERDQLLLEEKEKQFIKSTIEEKEARLKSSFQKFLEEEQRKEEESHRYKARHSLGDIWEEKKKKAIMQWRRISQIPVGYFAKFSKSISTSASEKPGRTEEQQPMEKESRSTKAKSKRKDYHKKSLKSASVTRLSKIISENLTLQENQEMPEDHDLDDDINRSPEDSMEASKELKSVRKDSLCNLCLYAGIPSSVWSKGQRATHWRVGQTHAFPDQMEKQYKQRLAKHERDSKVAVPFPLRTLMEEEVLAILKSTLADYQRKLGKTHPLTGQVEEQVERLHLQLQGRGMI